MKINGFLMWAFTFICIYGFSSVKGLNCYQCAADECKTTWQTTTCNAGQNTCIKVVGGGIISKRCGKLRNIGQNQCSPITTKKGENENVHCYCDSNRCNAGNSPISKTKTLVSIVAIVIGPFFVMLWTRTLS